MSAETGGDRGGRKLAAVVFVVGVLLLGAFLTPPDAVSQVLIAVPLYLLYEVGIVLCSLGERRRKPQVQP